MNPEEIARLKAAGFSDAEIAAHIRETMLQPHGFGRESTSATGPVSAPHAETPAAFVKGAARAGAQGATFGFADEGEAGLRSLFGGGDYRTIRDGIRQQDEAFSTDHPVVSLAANVGGGLLTGGAALKGAQGAGRIAQMLRVIAPEVNAAASTGQKALRGMRAAGASGLLAGAGGARELSDVPLSAVVNAGLGAGLGAGFGVASSAVKSLRNVASKVGQGQDEPGVVRQFLRAETPEGSATARFLSTLGKQKLSVGDFAARSATADAPDIAGEVIGSKGIRAVRSARALGNEAPDMIEQGLTTRARDDTGRVRSAVTQELGPQLDDVALKEAKLAEARAASGPLYQQALDGVSVADPRVLDMVQKPNIRSAFGTARTMAQNDGQSMPSASEMLRGAARGSDATDESLLAQLQAHGEHASSLPDEGIAPELPRIAGNHIQNVKHALQDAMTHLEGKTGGTSTKQYAQLQRSLNEVDDLLYEHANQADDGSSLWGQANAAYAKPMQQADAFAAGVRGGRTVQPVDVPRLLGGEHPEYTAKGIANTIHDDLARLGDGAAGPIRNPAPTLMGSDAARARLEAAANGDLGKVGRVEDIAANVARRLQTRQIVTGGSQTAEKLADQAEHGLTPGEIIASAVSPKHGILSAIKSGANSVHRSVVGDDMDAFAKLLMAGGPRQMTREELVALLRAAVPQAEQAQRRSLLMRGQLANQVGQRVQQ